MSRKDDVPYTITFCPIPNCRCPLQRMSDKHGPVGTLEDSVQAHLRIVHPGEKPE